MKLKNRLKRFRISEEKKLKGVFCCAYSCKQKPEYKKGGLCHKHYARKIRELDPVQSRYNQFCSNARRREKENTITIEEFRSFCIRTGYLIEKGKRGQNATIDRRCNAHGYHLWNIQLLTNKQNASKGCKDNGPSFECPF
jgi:hypothetical protein